eukprot:GILK01018703.1.p1 GENE.GILK01018703.1~~GILK01018703.1.p1  ORF type:complete len:238 (+),score=17.29 GILK01018703.1:53-715(+)
MESCFSEISTLCASDPSLESNGWKFVKQTDGVNVYTKEATNSPFLIIRGETTVTASVEDILNFLNDRNNLRACDPMMMELKEIEAVGDGHHIVYSQIKTPWPVANRDFVMESCSRIVDGVGFSVGFSVDHKSAPQLKGFVRGHIHASGYMCRPNNENKDLTDLVFIAQVDPKGMLPAWFVNCAAAGQATNVARIRDLFLMQKHIVPVAAHTDAEPVQAQP